MNKNKAVGTWLAALTSSGILNQTPLSHTREIDSRDMFSQ